MKPKQIIFRALGAGLIGFLFLGQPSQADITRTQRIQLKPGWNAVYLEVDPILNKPDEAFAGLPVAQAATYYPQTSPVQFIQNPDEKLWNKEGWSYWAPPSAPDSAINNLFSLQANQAYLLFCTANASWEIRGTPRLLLRRWQPESFNWVGFMVEPAGEPTFAQYFAGSSAHAELKIFELRANIWTRVEKPAEARIVSGQSYWVWCGRGNEYPGPLGLTLPAPGDGVNFIEAASELSFDITNYSSSPLSFTLSQIPNSADDPDVPLSLVSYDVNSGKIYVPFTVYTIPQPLTPLTRATLRLAIRKPAISTPEVSSLLKLSDSIGCVVYIPVTAVQSPDVAAGRYSGLWIGRIEVDKVNEAASKIDAATPKDVKYPFDLRLLLHADANGQVRLIKDVTLMQKRYVVEENGETTEMMRRVLITDDALISQFEGVVRRDGKLTGVRIGGSSFDFDSVAPNINELPLTGAIQPSGSLTGELILSETNPSNPFRHKYHPDHNIGFKIIRDITLTFDSLLENPSPEDGVSKLKGKYEEKIMGLHKNPIAVAGTFHLERISTIEKLNDQ